MNSKLHLCCRQNLYRWEVRDQLENILFYGDLEECKEYLKCLR